MSTKERIDTLLDYLDVPALHGIAIAITFTNVENLLKIISLTAAIGYTIWKWRHEYINRKKKK